MNWEKGACVERSEASGSKGDLFTSSLFTVPWLQKEDARPPEQNLPAEISAGGLAGGKRVRVLIAGHSIVLGASHRAKYYSPGADFGLSPVASVQWLGKINLKWSQLLPTIFQDGVVWQKPDMVVLHAGGNDLGLMPYNNLLKKVIEDLEEIRQRWPGVVILWSNILPRRSWINMPIMKLLCKKRKQFNRQMRRALIATGDGTISHYQINPSCNELYGKDGISLSAAGNDIFLSNLHTEIKAHILRRWGKKD
ncbi:Hypothetical predicted protein [Podarcis lilfordi]|uniref:SGNH hydrolase-type esterase domain-containing protein n=1 Tax=Podarcis lilfordi TaxID=74358 RepID=A0AA35KWP7_9SAUR|nr:Hypothetical predicted protein [Podarcis lilfordi]